MKQNFTKTAQDNFGKKTSGQKGADEGTQGAAEGTQGAAPFYFGLARPLIFHTDHMFSCKYLSFE